MIECYMAAKVALWKIVDNNASFSKKRFCVVESLIIPPMKDASVTCVV